MVDTVFHVKEGGGSIVDEPTHDVVCWSCCYCRVASRVVLSDMSSRLEPCIQGCACHPTTPVSRTASAGELIEGGEREREREMESGCRLAKRVPTILAVEMVADLCRVSSS